ncbi:MAG: GNAT family N-acetyltransferase [Microscillaceae bacterium]
MKNSYKISNEASLLQIDWVYEVLAQTEWNPALSRTQLEKALQHSACFGIYYQDQQVGFARVITDYATFGYIVDLFIDAAHRHRGLANLLIEYIINHPDLQGFSSWMVANDAPNLYRKYGFVPSQTRRWMVLDRMEDA